MRKRILVCTMVTVGTTCGGEDGGTSADTVARAEKDSTVADLPVPGAAAVGSAIGARNPAAARSAENDTIR